MTSDTGFVWRAARFHHAGRRFSCYFADTAETSWCRSTECCGNRIVNKMKLLPFARTKWHAVLYAAGGSTLIWWWWLARW
ncbi:hypothetical protein [Acidisoma silvae]|uniref:Uncharacterized protein n=1 Tax=Acidisoma silvae TaxID=2802396 RepID=A0A963YTH8_9PROT|nr:hypothetical protein [Acidisoma silvae]MCB8876399.1 hypothetical protein [Acidisoma silvae]